MMYLRLRQCLWACSLGLTAMAAHADEHCRIAFDVGSSGIRVGASNSQPTARVDIDYLSPLWAGRGLQEIIAPTTTALRQLPVQAQLDSGCQRVAGGFSAWRLAWSQSAEQTLSALQQIHTGSGVALLVIPQTVEGSYGYTAARQKLGARLQTSHILDIGGGSLQIAGERSTYGKALGQKFWHRVLCQQLRPKAPPACTLQPLNATELAQARQLLQEQLHDLAAALPESVSMTAISRPVTQGVQTAVQRLLPTTQPHHSALLQRTDLAAAIEQLAPLSLDATVQHTGIAPPYANYLLSDMLLTEGLLQATAGQHLYIQEIKVANVPGLLADTQAFGWAKHYGCYLQRLQQHGPAAYFSDPQTCTANPTAMQPPALSPSQIPAGERPSF
ncbi:hypothetical protein [Giesbergeria sinuosa]